MKVLLVKLSSIGDVAHTLPIAYALTRHWPRVHLDWLVGSKAAPLVREAPWVETTIESDSAARTDPRGILRRACATAARLRSRDYDLVIDCQGLLRSSVWTVLAGARRRIGRGRWPWLDHSVTMYAPASAPHAIENTARPLMSLGIDIDGLVDRFVDEAAPPLAAALEDRARALTRELRLERFWVWLPQSSWPSKSLSLDRAAAAPAALSHLVIGDERYRDVPLPSGGHWRNLSGLPLPETAGLSLLAERVIGADTGPAQYAALLGARAVGCFGPTRAERSGLRGRHARNEQGSCRGCRRRRCRRAEACLDSALVRAIAPAGQA